MNKKIHLNEVQESEAWSVIDTGQYSPDACHREIALFLTTARSPFFSAPHARPYEDPWSLFGGHQPRRGGDRHNPAQMCELKRDGICEPLAEDGTCISVTQSGHLGAGGRDAAMLSAVS